MVSLLMQTRLGNTHQSMKEFPNGNPIREAFYKKVKTDRVKTHIDYLFNEVYGNKFDSEEQEILLKDQYKKALAKLRIRGYSII